jgi:hypothetical protein
VGEVSRSALWVPCTESLVVTIDKSAMIVDDVEAVMRFVPAREPVRGAENNPEPRLRCEQKDLLDASLEKLPVKLLGEPHVSVRVPGETGLREMRDVGSPGPGLRHLAQDVLLVRANIGSHRELTRDHVQSHGRIPGPEGHCGPRTVSAHLRARPRDDTVTDAHVPEDGFENLDRAPHKGPAAGGEDTGSSGGFESFIAGAR